VEVLSSVGTELVITFKTYVTVLWLQAYNCGFLY